MGTKSKNWLYPIMEYETPEKKKTWENMKKGE